MSAPHSSSPWHLTLERDAAGGLTIPLPDALTARVGWAVGDRLAFRVTDDARVLVRRLAPHEPLPDGEYEGIVTARTPGGV